VDDLGERRIDRHWWNETKATAEGVTNEQAQAWLVRADDAGRLAKALLEARAEIERLTAEVRIARTVQARAYLEQPLAWTTEDGGLCVLGTHDRQHAHKAVLAYLEETGNDGDEEWDAWASDPATIANGERLFVDPLVVEEEEWPRTSVSAGANEPGWLPYLFARYP